MQNASNLIVFANAMVSVDLTNVIAAVAQGWTIDSQHAKLVQEALGKGLIRPSDAYEVTEEGEKFYNAQCGHSLYPECVED